MPGQKQYLLSQLSIIRAGPGAVTDGVNACSRIIVHTRGPGEGDLGRFAVSRKAVFGKTQYRRFVGLVVNDINRCFLLQTDYTAIGYISDDENDLFLGFRKVIVDDIKIETLHSLAVSKAQGKFGSWCLSIKIVGCCHRRIELL